MWKRLSLGFVILGITSCATTTDPRHGGLFSYNPKVYESRLQERRQTIAALEKKNQENQQQLETEWQITKKELERQQQDVDNLETELIDIQKTVDTYQAQSQKQSEQKAQLMRKFGTAKENLDALNKANSQGGSVSEIRARQSKIQELKTDIEKLLELMDLMLKSGQ